MKKKYYTVMLLLLVVLVLTTQMAKDVIATTSTYTLSDFNMTSVKPGLTLLSESNNPLLLPSKTHINAPNTFHKYWSLDWEPGTFNVTVGVFHYVDEELFGNMCTPTMDMTGYIVGAKAQAGCSQDVVARNHRKAGALGALCMSIYPIAGYPSLEYSWLPSDDLLDYPALEINGITRNYLITEFLAGNETVIAMASGDVNLHRKSLHAPDVIILHTIGVLINTLNLVYCIYIRKLMYDQAPKRKKWSRSLASTCIEIELLVCLLKYPTIILFNGGYHGISFRILVLYGCINGDLTSITSALMIFYWISQTNGNRKTVLKSTSGISKQSIIIVSAVEAPFILMSIVLAGGSTSGKGYFLGFPVNVFYIFKSLIQSIFFGTLFMYFGAKFMLYLSSSARKASTNSIDENKINILKRMMKGLFASASAMILNVYILYAFSFGPLSWVVRSPLGPGKVLFTTDFIVGCIISFTQILTFGQPVIRKNQVNKTVSTKQGSSNTSSSTTSSGYVDSSAGSSSVASSSSAVSSSSDITTNTTTSTSKW